MNIDTVLPITVGDIKASILQGQYGGHFILIESLVYPGRSIPLNGSESEALRSFLNAALSTK
jgi:hypothetical protein